MPKRMIYIGWILAQKSRRRAATTRKGLNLSLILALAKRKATVARSAIIAEFIPLNAAITYSSSHKYEKMVAMIVMIKKEGSTMPSVAAATPANLPMRFPIKMAELMATAPGKD